MPITTQSGFAADGRPESPRPYPVGKEPGVTAKGSDLAHVTDLANQIDRGK